MSDQFRKAKAYHPLRTQGKDRSFVIGAWDVETEGLNGKLLLASWYIEGMSEPRVIIGEPDEIAKGILNIWRSYPNIRWYAHHSQYDWRYVIDLLLSEYKDSLEFYMRTEQDVFKINTVDFELVDSYALWGQSLKKFAEVFLPDLPKLEIDVANFDVNNPDHIEYAKRDAEILVKCLVKLDETIYQLFGTHIAYTIAATAIRAWRGNIDKSYFRPEYIDDFVRSAYFGGAVQGKFGQTFTDLYTYDINSSYPYVMREYGVPYGNYASVHYLVPDMPGIYRVSVTTPDDLIFPILPKRKDTGGIIWPSGTFNTTVTNMELEFAQEHGYKINKIYEGLIWNEVLNPFVDFVTYCEDSRREYKGTPLEIVIKLIQNSVYGKFGTRKERHRLFIPQCDEDYLGAAPWGPTPSLWIKKETDEDILALPQWAVFITANARLHLLRNIYENGVENVVYCDTDSITTSAPLNPEYIGDRYGQFKLEKEWKVFRAQAPKVYAGDEMEIGLTGAVKGMPKRLLTETDYKELIDGGHVSANILVVPSLKAYMKGDRENKNMTRRSTDPLKAASWKLQDEVMRPIRIMEEIL